MSAPEPQGPQPAAVPQRVERDALRLVGWLGVFGGLLLACVLGMVAGAIHLQVSAPLAPCEVGVLRATAPQARSPFGDLLVFGRVRVVAQAGDQRVTIANGTLGARTASIEVDGGGGLDVELDDPEHIGGLDVERRTYPRFEDIPSPPRNVAPHAGAGRYEVSLWGLREGEPLMRCARADGSPYFVRSTQAEREARRAEGARFGRYATMGTACAGAVTLLFALGLAALMLRRARRLRATDARALPGAGTPRLDAAALAGAALGVTPLDRLPEPFASYGAALRAGHAPSEHRVFFGAEGPLKRYLGVALLRLLTGGAALALGAFAAACALLVAGWPGLARVLFAGSGLGLTVGALAGLRYLVLRREVRRLRAAPGEHALALGPDGVLITLHHRGVPKMIVLPYRDTLGARLVARNSFSWELAWGSSLISPLAPDDLEAAAPRILQELRLAHRLLELGQAVTAAGLTALATRETATLRGAEHASPEALDILTRRANPQDAPLGVWVLPWSRPPERLASWLMLLLPLIPLLPVMAALFFLLYSRGKRDGHKLLLLPDALLICEDTTRVVPHHAIRAVTARGGDLVHLLHTATGDIPIDAGYGLTRTALEASLGAPLPEG